MTKSEYLQTQLEITLARFGADKENVYKIRSWCVTVWIGAVALVSSETVNLGSHKRLLLPFLPIVFFWLLDGLQFMFLTIHAESIKRLEHVLFEGIEPPVNQVRRISLGTSMELIPYKRKLGLYISCLFGIEQVTLFYGALFAGTIALSFLH